MNYDFDTIIERRNTNSLKYDFAAERGKPDGLLPLWVADMDFQAPGELLADVQKAVSHGIFGYTEVKQPYYDALCAWFSSRFGFVFSGGDVLKTPGVVFALAQCIRAFSKPGEAVLIQTPVYYPFYEVIRDNGRKLVTNPLLYQNGCYSIDFSDFEQKIADNAVKLFILCSPHNPVGRVWTREDLERLNDICKAHGVTVVSDEIRCDFVYSGYSHTSFGLLDENAVICTSPGKTFNLAGLQVANIIAKNGDYRRRLEKEISRAGYSQLNPLGLVAAQSAYTHGAGWLSELLVYLEGNIGYAAGFLKENLPQVQLVKPQGTYLLWLDFSAYALPQTELDRRMTHGAKLWLDSGTMFGVDGAGFQRMNIACPRTVLAEALKRLAAEFRQ